MALFNFEKKDGLKKVSVCSCQCGASGTEAGGSTKADTGCCCDSSGVQSVKVLGSGCKNCHTLLENTREALKTMGFSVEVGYITDMETIMAYGVMSMPALVVNEKVVSMGKVLKPADVEKLFEKLGFVHA